MDVRRLQRIQNHLPVQVASRRKGRKPSRLPSATPSLNALLAGLEAGRCVSQFNIFTGWAIVTALAEVLISVGLVWGSWTHKFGVGWLWGIGLLLPIGALPFILRLRTDAKRQQILLQLTGYDDPRVISPLTEGLFACDRRLRDASRIALIRLLPQLTTLDGERLPSLPRKRLYRCLSSQNARYSPELAYAALQGLQHIGDTHTLVVKSSTLEILTPNT